jgi:hypothetical protein
MARLRYAFLLLFLLVSPSCSDDEESPTGPSPATSQFTGVFTGPGDGGLMTLSIPLATGDLAPTHPVRTALAHDVQALATLALDAGGTINLAGTYSEETDSLALTGQGYSMAGRYDPAGPVPGVTGEWTGPPGPGFFDCAAGGTGEVHTYCGDETRTGIVFEPMQVGIAGLSDLFGFIVIDGEPIHLEGTVTASASQVYSLTAAKDLGGGAVLRVDGTFRLWNKDMWGEWVIESHGVPGDSGTWALAPCLAGTTGPN